MVKWPWHLGHSLPDTKIAFRIFLLSPLYLLVFLQPPAVILLFAGFHIFIQSFQHRVRLSFVLALTGLVAVFKKITGSDNRSKNP